MNFKFYHIVKMIFNQHPFTAGRLINYRITYLKEKKFKEKYNLSIILKLTVSSTGLKSLAPLSSSKSSTSIMSTLLYAGFNMYP